MNFISDLLAWESFEQFVSDKLLGHYDIITYKNPDKKGIDLIGEAYMEVKLDRMYKRTGNFFVEYKCNGKESGINRYEELQYFVMWDNTNFYVVEINEVKNVCETKWRPIRGWDWNRSEGYLVKVKDIECVAEYHYMANN